jgi:hypothetical protein
MTFLDEYGLWLLLCEIVVVAIATAGAIVTDEYWTQRAQRRKVRSEGLNRELPL